jgi:hypothetical protein
MAQQSNQAPAFVTKYTPESKAEEPVDTNPSDQQPPGVDDEEPSY